MKRMTGIVASLVLATGTLAWAEAPAASGAPGSAPNAPSEVKAITPQTTCPVMKGTAINKKLFVDYEGKRIYVCCRGCIAPIKKDPAKYVKEMEAAGITLEKTPETAKSL